MAKDDKYFQHRSTDFDKWVMEGDEGGAWVKDDY